ncbi:hypothetical protein KUCAC02_005412 [Chaenocephalus aceratus]|uniref:Uncharacterized protein n=1 Tax=Chaenocephalus aceratus TaxID=36190 RepID=A0ACB9WNJ9_CHAAC|nr:hypothetical protein KUCAC02_005412 [Chaenocephalus aceratus]
MDGDYVIGGVFSIHSNMHTAKHNYTTMPEPLSCAGSINPRELRFSRAMVFAIEQINNSTELLPGIKLGYEIYDSCASVSVAVHVAFQLSGGLDPVFNTGDKCLQSGMVMAVVGESGSTPSISVSRIIGPFNIPQVSYFATCACLSDKQQYPSFFRTIPSDQFQADALAKLVKHFGWTWIGAVRSDSDYGNNGMASFLHAARKEGICVEYSESFFRTHPRSRIQRVADVIRRSTAKVVVAFISPGDMTILLEELSIKPSPPRQWIGSESWVTDRDMLRFSFCAGAIGFGIEKSVIPGLRDFLLDLSPSKVAESPLLTMFWEEAFNCRLCVKLADSEPLALQSGGDVVIGGLFPLHIVAPKPQNSYHSKPQLTPCKGGLVQLVTFLSWLWVGTIGTTDDYSQYGIQAFSSQFKKQGGCVAFHLIIPKSPSVTELQDIANKLQSSTAQVVVVFATEGQLLDLFLELAERNVTGIQWVASEAWVTASLLTSPHFHPILEGTLGFSFPGVMIPDLEEFLLNVRPSPKPGHEFVNMFWEDLFGCRLEFRGEGSKEREADTLLQHLKKVNFTNQFEEKVYFDSNGEPVPLYDIINWQKDSKGKIRFVKVGSYDGSALLRQQLQIDHSTIVWTEGQAQVGHTSLKMSLPDIQFQVLPDDSNDFSTFCISIGSTECTKCPEYHWPDKEKVKCVAGIEEFLSFHDAMGIILVALTLLGVVLTTIVTVVFHRFRTTPIVKANNSEISFLLLLSLKLCFLCSLVFIGQPSVWTCRLRQATFAISFVLCLSCLLVKTIVVLLAFRANEHASRALKLFGPCQQRSLIICTIAPQVCLCAGWLLGAPSFPFKNPNYQASTGKKHNLFN